MKKLKTLLALWLMAMTMGYTLTSCEKEEIDIPGSVTVKMRNDGSSIYWNDSRACLYINKSNNFRTTSYDHSEIASVGKVKGLGNIKKIPESGWAQELSVIVGHGYVVRYTKYDDPNQYFYARVFVRDEIIGTSGGIIGYTISYIEGM